MCAREVVLNAPLVLWGHNRHLIHHSYQLISRQLFQAALRYGSLLLNERGAGINGP
jgi:hypothetical protein